MKIKETITSQKGFYIGDICYVLSDKLYEGTLGAKHKYASGKFTDDETHLSVAVGETAYGDYEDNDGNSYSVDAGVIGIVPLELVSKAEGAECGRVCFGAGTAELECENGVFVITMPKDGIIVINTQEEEDTDEAEDDYETMDPEEFLEKYLMR